MKKTTTCALLCLAIGSARGDVAAPAEDFLQAPDRIEWHAGGLYDGRFEDGTRFQIQLAYQRPASVPRQVMPFAESYWYPKHYTGQTLRLTRAATSVNPVHLVLQQDPQAPVEESFSITLAPDALSGLGSWTSAKLHKRMAFSLQRVVAYDYVAVTRPAPVEARDGDPERSFVFAASFPVLGDADADAWIREQAGRCEEDLECMNEIRVRWKSRSLLSLNASAWGYGYGAAHGNGTSVTRQYGIDREQLAPLGLDAFVDPDAACASSMTAAILAQLHIQQLDWADKWAQSASLGRSKWLKFTPTASGIAFHFDPYEVGPYAQGAPSVFLTRAQLGTCLRHLPASD